MELDQVIYFKEAMMGNIIRDPQLLIMEFLKEILLIHLMEATDSRVI